MLKFGLRHLPLIAALGFATLSSIGVYQYLENKDSIIIAAPAAPTLPVVVARHQINPGTKLTPDMLTSEEWPEATVNENHFTSPKELVGRVLKSNMITGEPVTAPKLLMDGENFSALIPPDMRAVTVNVRKSRSLAKMLQKGSLVDVILVPNDGQSGMDAKVIADSARVMAVDHGQDDKDNKRSSTMEVILLVKVQDAAWVVYGMNYGVIELVVRNENLRPIAVAVVV